MTACTDPAHGYLNLAPIPCTSCHGWLDRDGTVLTTPQMLARYPHLRAHVAATPRAALPDYRPTTGDQAAAAGRMVTDTAWAMSKAVYALVGLAVIVIIVVAALGSH